MQTLGERKAPFLGMLDQSGSLSNPQGILAGSGYLK